MSSSDSQFSAGRTQPAHGVPVPGSVRVAAARRELDAALDCALRDVPLPEGLLTRLHKIVYSVSDTPADRLDWLGC